jgi:hypothetical protein
MISRKSATGTDGRLPLPSASRPHLLRASKSSSAGRQNANGRDKPGHCNVEGSANRFLERDPI